MNRRVFREYDIRALVDIDLTPAEVYLFGRALGTYYRRQGKYRLVSQTLTDLLADLPQTIITPEIRRDCPDEGKFQVVAGLKSRLRDHFPIIDIDGVRLLHPQGRGLVRASNTQPALVLRFEAETPEALAEIRNLVEAHLEQELAANLEVS